MPQSCMFPIFSGKYVPNAVIFNQIQWNKSNLKKIKQLFQVEKRDTFIRLGVNMTTFSDLKYFQPLSVIVTLLSHDRSQTINFSGEQF